MHQQMPEEQEHLAALAQHKTRTQADYYRVCDKVSQTDLGRRAVKKLVSLKGTEIHKKEQESTSWTKEEEEKLQHLFKEEIATGAVNESELKEKVSTTNLLEAHSFKAIVFKLRRMSAEQRKEIPLPSEQMTSSEKVMNFLSSTRFESSRIFVVLHLYGTREDTKIWAKKIYAHAKKCSRMEVFVAEGRWKGQKRGGSVATSRGMNAKQGDYKCGGRINTLPNTHGYYDGL